MKGKNCSKGARTRIHVIATALQGLTRLIAFVALLIPAMAAAGFCAGDPNPEIGGAKAICTKPEAKGDWVFTVNDCSPSFVPRSYAWCMAMGGTWDPYYINGPICVNYTAVTQVTLLAVASDFIQRYHDPCLVDLVDSGWTGSANAGGTCGVANSLVIDGIVRSQVRLLTYSGSKSPAACGTFFEEKLLAGMAQTVGCPAGTVQSSDPDRGQVCVKYQFCDKCLGNPVDAATGVKVQREVDYSAGGVGGLTFERLYNSSGYFSRVERRPDIGDYWRHSWAGEIVAITDLSGIMAAARRPDGSAKYFKADGKELQNHSGGSLRLERLTDAGGATTGWRLTTDASDTETYNAQGKLTQVQRRTGHNFTLAYDAEQRLQTVTDAFGRQIALGYDALGRHSTLTDPAGRTYTYGFDAASRLSTVTYPGNQTRTYLYEDSRHAFALTGIVDERGRRLSTYTYDDRGRVLTTERSGPENKYTFSYPALQLTTWINTVQDAFGATHTYTFEVVDGVPRLKTDARNYLGTESRTFDAVGNVATKTNRRGMVTTYAYDLTRNLETSRTEAYGTARARTITTTWHPTYRLPATVTQPSGVSGVNEVTTYTYDASGNLTKKNVTAGALVREWNYTVNSLGQVLTVNGPRTDVVDVTTMTYYPANDPCMGCRGQVWTVTNAAGHVTTFNAYTADGRPSQVTDPNGAVTAMTYTPRGWLESRSVAGETTGYQYDAAGNLTRVTLPDLSWVQYTYDDANGLIRVEDRLGNSVDYELDVMGNRVDERVKDPQGALKKLLFRSYDGGNRLFRETGSTGQVTEYAYSDLLPTSVKDPLYHTTSKQYDELDRLTQVNDPAGGYTWFTYDAKDRLKTVQDPRGLTTTYTYNGLGDLVTQASPDTGTTSFTHDAAGNVATQTDARSVSTTYAYDTLNRVLSATVTDGTVSYEYDNVTTGGAGARGRLTKITDPSGTTLWAYDLLGRVSSKIQTVGTAPAAKTFTTLYGYTAGLLTSITYPSGRVVTTGYDLQGQAASVSVDGTAVLSGGLYQPFGGVRRWTWGNGQAYERFFDLDGRINGVTLGPSTGTYADLNQGFGYDTLNRLISAGIAAGQALGYGYDANGNRTSTTVNGASTTTYNYPGSSHKLSSLTGATSRSFTYDLAGNLTSSAGITYVYDGRGRMKQAGGATYLVNGLGQRVRKSSGGDTYFNYDEAGRLIGEYDSTGAPIQEYAWLGDIPAAIIKPATPSGFSLYYVWADHLGTPRVVSDTANQVRWEWPLGNPFGAHQPNENPGGAGLFKLNLRFPGQYYDTETGLHYNYFRDYDPAIGRYVQSDPIGLRGGISTFGYVGAAPVTEVDRLGLANSGGFRPIPFPAGWQRLPDRFIYHGFWCGPGWTGGLQESFSPSEAGYRKPTDGLDQGCYLHDICYYDCRAGFPCNAAARGKCMTRCDRVLANAAAGAGSRLLSPLWWWMAFNGSPEPGSNDPKCPQCPSN